MVSLERAFGRDVFHVLGGCKDLRLGPIECTESSMEVKVLLEYTSLELKGCTAESEFLL